MRERQKTQPPTLKDMLKIIWGLVVVCILSAVVLGGVYLWTQPIKEKNQVFREQNTLRKLLEISSQGVVEEVRRYMNPTSVFYVTTKGIWGFTLEGQKINQDPLPEEVASKKGEEQLEELQRWMNSHKGGAQFVGRFFVGKENNQKVGYVVEGHTLGYKAKIRFFLAMDQQLSLRGLEIVEQEEDPGLGGEISQRYFKNQFAGRTLEDVENLKVTKDPLPEDWKKVVESLGGTISQPLPFSKWIEQNTNIVKEHPRIYAITGSTISSESVTQGVKKTLNQFHRRLQILSEAL